MIANGAVVHAMYDDGDIITVTLFYCTVVVWISMCETFVQTSSLAVSMSVQI